MREIIHGLEIHLDFNMLSIIVLIVPCHSDLQILLRVSHCVDGTMK